MFRIARRNSPQAFMAAVEIGQASHLSARGYAAAKPIPSPRSPGDING